jgi:hypothetical protein
MLNEIIAIIALVVCLVAIYISIKIYRDTPKIDKKKIKSD